MSGRAAVGLGTGERSPPLHGRHFAMGGCASTWRGRCEVCGAGRSERGAPCVACGDWKRLGRAGVERGLGAGLARLPLDVFRGHLLPHLWGTELLELGRCSKAARRFLIAIRATPRTRLLDALDRRGLSGLPAVLRAHGGRLIGGFLLARIVCTTATQADAWQSKIHISTPPLGMSAVLEGMLGLLPEDGRPSIHVVRRFDDWAELVVSDVRGADTHIRIHARMYWGEHWAMDEFLQNSFDGRQLLVDNMRSIMARRGYMRRNDYNWVDVYYRAEKYRMREFTVLSAPESMEEARDWVGREAANAAAADEYYDM